MDIDLVVFRRWKDCGSIIALFPEIPADLAGRYCESYEHVGQHGGADYYCVIQATEPVELHEAVDLAEELAADRLQLAAHQADIVETSRKAAAGGKGMRPGLTPAGHSRGSNVLPHSRTGEKRWTSFGN